MARTEIDGDQVQDETLTGSDVLDESLKAVDLDIEDVATGLVTNTNAINTINEAIVFGQRFNQSFTTGNFTTTSSTFQTMQTIPSAPIETGNYLIMTHGRYLKTSLNGQLGVRIQVNGTTVIDEEEVSLDDDDFFFGHTMIVYVPNLSGNITVTSQIRKIGGGGSVQAESRTLTYWRVS